MSSRSQGLIVSHSEEGAEAIRSLIGDEPDYALDVRVCDPKRPDPLEAIVRIPDLLILHVEAGSTAALKALERYTLGERPPLIVISDAADAECMRVAMRVGARDFLVQPVDKNDLLAVIRLIHNESRASRRAEQGRLIAFVNAKGGSGASFLACNVAHLLASVSSQKTALVDLDLQFSTLPHYLDLHPRSGLVEALDVADDLDAVAIDGFLTRHHTGLCVLAGTQDSVMLQQELMTDRFEMVLNLLAHSFECVVVDLPRRIEPFSATVLERADHIVLVLQQTVPSLHDATRMHDILTRNLAVPRERIRVVVNRHQKNASVEVSDIQHALRSEHEIICVPNDHRAVAASIDMGVPIYENARRSAVTKALMRLEDALGGKALASSKGLLPRLLRTG